MAPATTSSLYEIIKTEHSEIVPASIANEALPDTQRDSARSAPKHSAFGPEGPNGDHDTFKLDHYAAESSGTTDSDSIHGREDPNDSSLNATADPQGSVDWHGLKDLTLASETLRTLIRDTSDYPISAIELDRTVLYMQDRLRLLRAKTNSILTSRA